MPLINLNNRTADADRQQCEVIIPGNEGEVIEQCRKMAGLDSLIKQVYEHRCTHFVSDGSWSLYDYLLAMLDNKNMTSDVWLTTYSMTELSARILAKLKASDKIGNLHVLMDYKSKMRYPQVDQLIRNVATTMGLVHIHAKVLVIRTGHVCFTLIGSANWTKNPRLEVGVIDRSLFVAAQHIEWITKQIEHGANN